jgi:hypothetical protein
LVLSDPTSAVVWSNVSRALERYKASFVEGAEVVYLIIGILHFIVMLLVLGLALNYFDLPPWSSLALNLCVVFIFVLVIFIGKDALLSGIEINDILISFWKQFRRQAFTILSEIAYEKNDDQIAIKRNAAEMWTHLSFQLKDLDVKYSILNVAITRNLLVSLASSMALSAAVYVYDLIAAKLA